MAFEVLVDLREGRVGEIARVEPEGFAWSSKELRPGGNYLVVRVTGSGNHRSIRRMLARGDYRTAVEGDVEYDPENPGVELVRIHKRKWRMRLSELPVPMRRRARADGVISMGPALFRNACESKRTRRRFDPARADGEGNARPDAAEPLKREPRLPEPARIPNAIGQESTEERP